MTDRELQTLRNLGHDDAADEIEQLRNYCEALNQRCIADTPDAERYRWLKKRKTFETYDGELRLAFDCGFENDLDLDAAIDEAMEVKP